MEMTNSGRIISISFMPTCALRNSKAHRIMWRGMLLYPTTSYELGEAMLVQGHRIQLATLDLSQQWEKIETRLLSLVASGLVSAT
jgi:hypothetical protein